MTSKQSREDNVLEFLRRESLYRHGPRKGQPKRALSCQQFYPGPVNRLLKKGLIRFVDNALGCGYVAVSL
jgi:hypothetical protein